MFTDDVDIDNHGERFQAIKQWGAWVVGPLDPRNPNWRYRRPPSSAGLGQLSQAARRDPQDQRSRRPGKQPGSKRWPNSSLGNIPYTRSGPFKTRRSRLSDALFTDLPRQLVVLHGNHSSTSCGWIRGVDPIAPSVDRDAPRPTPPTCILTRTLCVGG
jgi:hypothetical protein